MTTKMDEVAQELFDALLTCDPKQLEKLDAAMRSVSVETLRTVWKRPAFRKLWTAMEEAIELELGMGNGK